MATLTIKTCLRSFTRPYYVKLLEGIRVVETNGVKHQPMARQTK